MQGRPLPAGLRQAEQLPEPIFTPTTKADAGHDLPLSDAEAADAGRRRPSTSSCATLTLAIYEFGAAHAATRGLILADTKFEFGDDRRRAPGDRRDAHPRLVAVLAAPTTTRSATSPPSFDKQYVRDHYLSIGWDQTPAGAAHARRA